MSDEPEKDVGGDKHPTLYFEDGDVELTAKLLNGGATQRYRVDRVVLRRASEVFADMFAVVGDRDEIVEMPDSAEDLAELLKILYDPAALALKLQKTSKCNAATDLFGLVRISRKYDIPSVADAAIQCVAAMWPQAFSKFQQQEAALASSASTPWYMRKFETPEPASAIKFAKEFNVPQILRAAYFTLYLTNPHNDWSASPYTLSGLHPAARWNLLDSADWQKLYRGRDRITRYLSDPNHLAASWSCISGRRKDARRSLRSSMLSAVTLPVALPYYQDDQIQRCVGFLKEFDDRIIKLPGLCKWCRSGMNSTNCARKRRCHW